MEIIIWEMRSDAMAMPFEIAFGRQKWSNISLGRQELTKPVAKSEYKLLSSEANFSKSDIGPRSALVARNWQVLILRNAQGTILDTESCLRDPGRLTQTRNSCQRLVATNAGR